MPRDITDRLIDRLSELQPEQDMSDLQVSARLARLGRHIEMRDEEVFGRLDLNRGEVGVLSALRVAGPPHRLSPTGLGKGLMLSSAGVTSRLDRLERRGLVARLPDPGDRRGVIVELTDRGRELVDAAVRANIASGRQLLSRLEPEEIKTLESLLRTILAGLELPEID
jgi:DNA-binding MarR family transcriptional regulator